MRITVFCGSSRRSPEPFRKIARTLGQHIAERGHELIYGGAQIGLMGELAQAALENNGRVHGIMLRQFLEQGQIHHPTIPMVVCEDMRSRKSELDQRCDAFIALPGGYGTLEELTEIISFRQIGLHHRPIILINPDGFYDPFLAQIHRAIQEGFIREKHAHLLHVTENPEEAVRLCEQLQTESEKECGDDA